MPDRSPLVAFAVGGLPTTNRGVSRSESPRSLVLVDWVSASVDLGALLLEFGEPLTWELLNDANGQGFHAPEIAHYIFHYLLKDSGVVLNPEPKRGSFYKWRFDVTTPIGAKCGQIEFGGPHTMRADGTPTARIELTGEGCRRIEQAAGDARSDHAKRWLLLQAKLASVGGRLSRCDCAFDDLDGLHTLAFAFKLWASGKFNARGQTPDCQQVSDAKGRSGDTLYIGSRTSEKFLRVYEKGKEQGDEASPWVRWEVQFRASSRRDLPLEMLTEPGAAIRGAYPFLEFVCDEQLPRAIAEASADATLKTALRHFRHQYGAAVNFLAQALPDDVALGEFLRQNVARPKLPKWADQYFGAEAFSSVLDAMRSPREGVTPATDSEIEELSHAR